MRRASSIARSAVIRVVGSALAGMFFYGGWAYLANASYGSAAAARIAAAQGAFSFGVTLCLSLVIEGLYQLWASRHWRVLLTILSTCGLLHSSAVVLHVAIGTPALVLTVLPGFIIGTAYVSVYTLGIARAADPSRRASVSS